MQILKYEIKKIFCKKSSVVSLILLGICLASMLYYCISSVSYVDRNGNEIKGIKAVKLLKNEKMKWNGDITEQTVSKVIKANSDINSESKYKGMKDTDIKLSNMQFSEKQGFMDIRDLINMSYGNINAYDYYFIDSMNAHNAGSFYTNRVNQIKTLVNGKESEKLTKNEKTYLINAAETLTTPLKYSYEDGWVNALDKSGTMMFILALIICVLMAPLFSVEYQTGSDAIILSTEHGKKKGIVYKIAAGLLSTTLVYWIAACIMYGFIFMVFGFEGGNCQVQTSSDGWKSFYHLTNSQALWMVTLLGYTGCLFISSLCMFLSSKIKTSFATIIITFLLIMVPSTIGKSIVVSTLWNRISSLLPHQMLLGWGLMRTDTLYDVFGKVMTPYQMLPVLYGIFVIILLPLAYRAFHNHQAA